MNHVKRRFRLKARSGRGAGVPDATFTHLPLAVPVLDIARAMRLHPSEASVYASFLGSVPAEETEEEFAAAVEAMS